MHPSLVPLALATLSSFLAAWSDAQQIFINQVPEYFSLGACAEPPLSTIVRDMYSGCGDGSQTTSYACFCSQSSSQMAGIISNAIISNCPSSTAQAQATSALQVFSSYCQLGESLGSKTITATAAATLSGTSTGDAASSSSSQTGISTGARIAIAISVSLVFLASCLGAFCVMRRYSALRRKGERIVPPLPPSYSQHDAANASSAPYKFHKSEIPAVSVAGGGGEKQPSTVVQSQQMNQWAPPVELPSRTSMGPVELSARKSVAPIELSARRSMAPVELSARKSMYVELA